MILENTGIGDGFADAEEEEGEEGCEGCGEAVEAVVRDQTRKPMAKTRWTS